MKRIRIILTRLDEHEMLTIKGPLAIGICAERFVIEDRREAVKAKPDAIGVAPARANQ